MSEAHWKIGVVCYPSFGGSGVMATEIAIGLARRGHQVHVMATAPPVRLRTMENLSFHQVHVPDYPLFEYTPYTLALASTIARVTQQHQLDLVHVHYAVPHAVSAYLACQMLADKAPRVVITLHGTDVTIIGAEDSYRPVVRMALLATDSITTPSAFLRDAAYSTLLLPQTTPISVIPNFVDTQRFQPLPRAQRRSLRYLFAQDERPDDLPILLHISNFRRVKRVQDVVAIFARVTAQRPARLILLGEGPDRADVMQQVHDLGLDAQVCFLGNQASVLDMLQHCEVLLLPSETESFGLVALEALSCGVPVVASDVGGLPELVRHNHTGILAPVGDVDAMAQATLTLLNDPTQRAQFSQQAREDVVQRWDREQIICQYEQLFQTLVGSR